MRDGIHAKNVAKVYIFFCSPFLSISMHHFVSTWYIRDFVVTAVKGKTREMDSNALNVVVATKKLLKYPLCVTQPE